MIALDAESRMKPSRRDRKNDDPSQSDGFWSNEVTRRSNALDLEPGVFTWDDPRDIARSLRRSAEESSRRKADPFRSAMSMLNFFVNRAGKTLPSERKLVLQRAKDELRKEFGRAPHRE
jgi:hypothetical protein